MSVLAMVPFIGSTADAAKSSRILLRTQAQLQSKFKHSADFGVSGNYTGARAAEFSRALHRHINATSTQVIEGTYRGQRVTHFLDASSRLNVMQDASGNFVSGWQLSPTQLQNLLTHGGL